MNFIGGYWENPIEGYDLRGIPQTSLYIFELNPDKPLTYRMPEGEGYQPDRHFRTDMASIPRILQWIPGLAKDSFRIPAIYHDCVYKLGFIWKDGNRLYLTRKEADQMLRDMIHAEGGRILAWVYYLGVRIGGAGSWHN